MTRTVALGLLGVAALVAPLVVYPVLLMTILCFVIFACSFNLLLGYTGLLCFGHAMFFGTAAYVTGFALKNSAMPTEIGILLGALTGSVMGAAVGLVAVRRSGIQFAMITFAFAQFVFFLLSKSEFTGREDGMHKIPRRALLGMIDVSDNFKYYYFVLAVVALCVFCFYRIVHSPFGELLKAIRDNEGRVESLGFKPEQFKLIALTLSAGLAGLAGGLKATVYQFATLTDASWAISGEVILMTLLGGLGTLPGPMVGAAMIILLNDFLAQFGEWALIAQGCILLVVILAFRRGVVGEAMALMRRWQRPDRDQAPVHSA
jgi:branched-chain amino acid transport system permease protein